MVRNAVRLYTVEEANGLLTFGMGFDWSFEKDFFNKKNIDIHVYDYFIKSSHIKKYSRNAFIDVFKKNFLHKYKLYSDYKKFFTNRVKHFRNSIGIGPNLINLTDALKKFKDFPVFLKIDIEGAEYRILNEIINNQEKFSGLVIEFHEADLHKNYISDFINNFKLNLVHIHGQNVGDKSYLNKHGDPIQIEITFSKSKNILSDNTEIPHSLDQPCDPRYEEVKLKFEN